MSKPNCTTGAVSARHRYDAAARARRRAETDAISAAYIAALNEPVAPIPGLDDVRTPGPALARCATCPACIALARIEHEEERAAPRARRARPSLVPPPAAARPPRVPVTMIQDGMALGRPVGRR